MTQVDVHACEECGHPQSQHKGGRNGCRNCDIGCARYEAAKAVTVELDNSGTTFTTEPSRGLSASLKSHLTAPTSLDRLRADLARVEQENTDLRTGREQAVERALELAEANEALRAELAVATQAPAMLRKNEEIRAQVIRERNDEISRLRSELEEQAKTLTAQADLTATVDRLTAELGRALGSLRATERELATTAGERDNALGQLSLVAEARTQNVLSSYDAWQCLAGPNPCGRRYTKETAAADHACGPMSAVTVTITLRKGATPA